MLVENIQSYGQHVLLISSPLYIAPHFTHIGLEGLYLISGRLFLKSPHTPRCYVHASAMTWDKSSFIEIENCGRLDKFLLVLLFLCGCTFFTVNFNWKGTYEFHIQQFKRPGIGVERLEWVFSYLLLRGRTPLAFHIGLPDNQTFIHTGEFISIFPEQFLAQEYVHLIALSVNKE